MFFRRSPRGEVANVLDCDNVVVAIYLAFCLDVPQDRMNGGTQ